MCFPFTNAFKNGSAVIIDMGILAELPIFKIVAKVENLTRHRFTDWIKTQMINIDEHPQ
jgi:hypothetical protein